MAYADRFELSISVRVTTRTDPLSGQPETIAGLRDLYRASEARASRMRLLVQAGTDLAAASNETLEGILKTSARRAAHFAGCSVGEVTYDIIDDGIALIAPGASGRRVGTLLLKGNSSGHLPNSGEDAEALGILAQLMAAAMDRVAYGEERERLIDKIKDRETRLEQVVERLFSAQEDERRRVSMDLHDSVAQTASALFRRLEARSAQNSDIASEDGELADMAQSLVKELRHVIAGLRPTALDDLGLGPAISGLADALKSEGYDVDLNRQSTTGMPPLFATAFFRVCQEALTNVRKHAGGPCRVEIDLKSHADDGNWQLRVRDFGRGMPADTHAPAGPGEQVGISVMRERMTAIGGTLRIESTEGNGVTILAAVQGKPTS